MPDYEIPQFIGRENKLLGPLTVRQVLIIVAFILVLVILYFLIGINDEVLFYMLAFIIVSLGSLIVFAKYNGRPVSLFLTSLLSSLSSPRIYKWKKVVRDSYGKQKDILYEKPDLKLTEYKINRLAQFLDNSEE